MNESSKSKSLKEITEKAGEQKKKARKGMNDFQWFAMQVLIFVIVLYVLFAHIIGITTMPNADMYPRIDSGDFLMYYRLDKEPKHRTLSSSKRTTRAMWAESSPFRVTPLRSPRTAR